MNVVIHAGIHRTGTTSLQLFLEGNRAALRERGIIYPGETRNHQALAWALKRKPDDTAELNKLITAEPSAKTVVLSAEDFCIHTDLHWLKEISRTWDTRVIFYLRRQDHWVMSWYNQHVKWPFDRNKSRMGKTEFLESIRDFHWLNYNVLLERWASVLGAENVSAGVVEKGQVDDVVRDFATRLGTPHEGLHLDVQRVNNSLPVHMLEVARHLALYDLPQKSRVQLIRALRTALADKAPPAKTVYSPQERNGILEQFQKPNQKVAKRYFGRDSLFLEPAPGPGEPFYSFPEMPRQQFMEEWVVPVIRELLTKK